LGAKVISMTRSGGSAGPATTTASDLAIVSSRGTATRRPLISAVPYDVYY
jgi:hypothetical protein